MWSILIPQNTNTFPKITYLVIRNGQKLQDYFVHPHVPQQLLVHGVRLALPITELLDTHEDLKERG